MEIFDYIHWNYLRKMLIMLKRLYKLAENILPIPIEQRYSIEDMEYLVTKIKICTNEN